ncbi:MAG: RDD family protein [Azovibrio sp.]
MTEYPSVSRRLAAMLYEGLLLLGVLIFGFMLPYILLGITTNTAVPARVQHVHFILLLMAYYVWFWLHGGQTLAMKTWKIKVVDRSGAPLRPMQAVLRYLAAWPSLCLFGIGILWALFDKEKQFLHDRIADSRLILVTPTPKE